jgi:hypothetical protein
MKTLLTRYFLWSLGVLIPLQLSAQEINPSSEVINRGFIKTPSETLTKKFSVCDAFLNVDWIDKKKKIGYSTYEVYEKGLRKGEIFALIDMREGSYIIGLDVFVFKRDGKLPELFEQIRKAKVDQNGDFPIFYKGKELYISTPAEELTLADNRINVCVEHPDNGRVWIVEGKHINKVYEATQTDKVFSLLETILNTKSKSYPRDRKSLESDDFIVVDINHDGKDDYISRFELQTPIYSVADHYQKPTIIKTTENIQKEKTIAELSFLANQKKCIIPVGTSYRYLTTDGQNYFLGNKCNLTKLTQGEK